MYGRPQIGPPHDVRPLEVLVPDCGKRHAVVDLPSFEDVIKGGPKQYEADRLVIRANFHQLAMKVEHIRSALNAMGIPLTQEH
jgi:hypothetical protein